MMGEFTMDWNSIIQIAFGVVLSVGAYLYRDLKAGTDVVKAKADKTQEELLNYKLMAAEKYVTNSHLEQAVESLHKTLETVAASMVRVETRLNNQIDNSNHRSNNP